MIIMSNKKINNLFYSLLLLAISFIILSSNVVFANTYSNNSIEIEVSQGSLSYDYGENVTISINVKNKNRYAKLYYKILDVYTGGGFEALNINTSYKVIDELLSDNTSMILKDKYHSESKGAIAFNGKDKMTIGRHVYEITKKEYEEFRRYRSEKEIIEKETSEPYQKVEQEKIDIVKSQVNATLFIKVIVLLIIVIFIIFVWFIIKSKSRSGYGFMFIVFISTLLIGIILPNALNVDKLYAADIYNENVKCIKTISTQVDYANLLCTFDIKIEYYFVNTIAPITDLELDTDLDTLPDYLEVLYLTDLNDIDTDKDGLFDGVEVYNTHTDPLRIDSNNNGINDGDEDYDKDGLSNIEEKNNGTAYDNADTDFDNLSDYDEINGIKSIYGDNTYITDPLNADTDGDGLIDGTEIKLGLNPTNPNDADSKVNQTISKGALPKELTTESSIPISFRGELVGDIDENVTVSVVVDKYFDNLRAIVGSPVKIDTAYASDDGLKIVYDISKYNAIKDRIQLCKLVDGKLVMIENTYVENNTLVGDVSSGVYVLVDIKLMLQEANIFN